MEQLPDGISITPAATEPDRRATHRFIERYIPLEPTAIPALNVDGLYDPVILTARATTGGMVGALLACRPRVAVAMSMLGPAADPGSKVMELDLLAVDASRRRSGIGSSLLRACGAALEEKGARILFGGVTDASTSPQVASFYRDAGYAVLADGQHLPPFLGRTWVMPFTEGPVFWFWKRIA